MNKQQYQKVKITDITLDRPLPVNILINKDELLIKIRQLAQQKTQENLLQTILLSMLGGFYSCTAIHFTVRSIAALTTFHVNSNSEQIKVTKFGPGVIRGIYGGFYPIAMLLILINGGDIFLAQLFYYLIAMFKKCINIPRALFKLVYFSFLLIFINKQLIVFAGNCISALFYTWLFMYLTKLFEGSTYKNQTQQLTSQFLDYNFFQTLLLGIGCGIILSFAFMINLAGRSTLGRIMSIIFIIALYPILQFQHFQDNLCLFPIALWYDGQFTEGDFVGKNLIPVFLGNIIGVAMIAAGYALSEKQEEKIQQQNIIEQGHIQEEIENKN